MKIVIALLTIRIGEAAWERCPSECECPKEKVVKCNGIGNYETIPTSIPSETTYLEFLNNGLQKLTDDTFSHLNNLVYLNLGSNQISRVSAKAFDTVPNLRVLWMDNNNLRSLPDDVFYKCENIEQVNLAGNQLEYVQHYLFADLPELKQIFLQENMISFIHPKAFVDNIGLKRLFLHNNSLITIEREWFLKLSELQEMYIDNNLLNCNCQLQNFTDWAMLDPTMRKLFTSMNDKVPRCHQPEHLKNKEIYTVEKLDDCTEPFNIHIQQNYNGDSLSLTCAAEGEPAPTIQWFKGEDIKTSIVISSNPNIFIPKLIDEDAGNYICLATNFKGEITASTQVQVNLEHIKSPVEAEIVPLDFVGNHRKDYVYDDEGYKIEGYSETYDDDYIDCGIECECEKKYDRIWADCREARITNFFHVKGKLPREINILDLKENEFDSIQDYAFENFTQLEELHLDQNNHIGESLGQNVFVGLKKLNVLTAREIGLNTIGVKLIPLINLKSLVLSNNEITKVTNRNFLKLTHLQQIHLDHNQIFSIEKEAFHFLPNLKYLYIQHNKLKSIEAEWFSGFSNSLFIAAYLTENGIRCDCSHVGSFALRPDKHHMLEDDGMNCSIERMKELECQEQTHESQKRNRMNEEVIPDELLDQLWRKKANKNVRKTTKKYKRIKPNEYEVDDETVDEFLDDHFRSSYVAKVHKEPKYPDYSIDDDYREMDQAIIPSHHVKESIADKIIPIDTNAHSPDSYSNTTWALTVFVIFASLLLAATFKRWRRALLRLLLKCGDNSGIHRPGYQYQRMAEHNMYFRGRETLI